jgi:predicted XRE-type DNA-binding protein
MTDIKPRTVHTTADLKPGHWLSRQLPAGASLRGYAEDRAIATITRSVQQTINEAGLSRSDLARLLGTTKSYVSQVLNGSTNMTLKTLGALLWASGHQVVGLEHEQLGNVRKIEGSPVIRLQVTSSAVEPGVSGSIRAIRGVG